VQFHGRRSGSGYRKSPIAVALCDSRFLFSGY
jgi:hypothetical protein